jgi:hypothetical protein
MVVDQPASGADEPEPVMAKVEIAEARPAMPAGGGEPAVSILSADLRNIERKPRQIFVAYPYGLFPESDYRRVFKELEKAFDVQFVFADEKITNLHILQKIYGMIRESAFGIYDISGWNPNVTLELGMAYGLSEAPYLIVNPSVHESGEAPADLRGLDRLEWGSYTELSDVLTRLMTQRMAPPPAEDPDAYLKDVSNKAVALLERSPGLSMAAIAKALRVAMPIAQAAVRPMVGKSVRIQGATRGTRYFPLG